VPLPVVRFFCGINQIVWFLLKKAPFSASIACSTG